MGGRVVAIVSGFAPYTILGAAVSIFALGRDLQGGMPMVNAVHRPNRRKERWAARFACSVVWLVIGVGACSGTDNEPTETSAEQLGVGLDTICEDIGAPLKLQVVLGTALPKTLSAPSSTLKLNITNSNPHSGTVTVSATTLSEFSKATLTAATTSIAANTTKAINVSANALGLTATALNFPGSLEITARITYPANPKKDTRAMPLSLYYHPQTSGGWLVYDDALRQSTYHALTPQGAAQRQAALDGADEMGIDLDAEIAPAFVELASTDWS